MGAAVLHLEVVGLGWVGGFGWGVRFWAEGFTWQGLVGPSTEHLLHQSPRAVEQRLALPVGQGGLHVDKWLLVDCDYLWKERPESLVALEEPLAKVCLGEERFSREGSDHNEPLPPPPPLGWLPETALIGEPGRAAPLEPGFSSLIGSEARGLSPLKPAGHCHQAEPTFSFVDIS